VQPRISALGQQGRLWEQDPPKLRWYVGTMRPSPVVARRFIHWHSQEELQKHTDSAPEPTRLRVYEGERRSEHPLPHPHPTHDGCLSELFASVIQPKIWMGTSDEGPRLHNASLYVTSGVARGSCRQPLDMVIWCVGFRVIPVSPVLTPLFFRRYLSRLLTVVKLLGMQTQGTAGASRRPLCVDSV